MSHLQKIQISVQQKLTKSTFNRMLSNYFQFYIFKTHTFSYIFKKVPFKKIEFVDECLAKLNWCTRYSNINESKCCKKFGTVKFYYHISSVFEQLKGKINIHTDD